MATLLTAVFGCLAMGLYANRPIAVAPYMGENAFLALGLAALGITWQQRLGAVFLSGAAFALITVLRVRPWLSRAVSSSMKHSFAAGLLDEKGDLPQIERPMMVDAAARMFSGLVGTSTSWAYIESAAGIREGARTGLAAVITATLFALSLFVLPLIAPLQSLRYAYAPALVAVGLLMMGSFAKIDFADLTAAPLNGSHA